MVLKQELLNEQLSDGREWILDTVTPGFADVGIYFLLAWMRSFRKTRPVFDPEHFPHAVSVSSNISLSQNY